MSENFEDIKDLFFWEKSFIKDGVIPALMKQ